MLPALKRLGNGTGSTQVLVPGVWVKSAKLNDINIKVNVRCCRTIVIGVMLDARIRMNVFQQIETIMSSHRGQEGL